MSINSDALELFIHSGLEQLQPVASEAEYQYIMFNLLPVAVLLCFLQCYVYVDSAETATALLLSKENANSFLQSKNRARRGLHEGLREECCTENCDFEERAEFAESYEWDPVGDALCEISHLERRSCTCKARAGYNYECGTGCSTKPCKCEGTKDSKYWDVIDISYDIKKGSLDQKPVAASSKEVDNLQGEAELAPSFTVSTTVTEEEYFSHTVGASLTIGSSFSFGVPGFGEGTISQSLTVSTSHTFGKRTSKSVSRSATLPCKAPPHRYAVCYGMINVVKMRVPYTMKIKHNVFGCTCTVEGVYENVHHTNVFLKASTHTSKPSEDELKEPIFL